MKIKRPNKEEIATISNGRPMIDLDWFMQWFDECVEPINEMLAEGVEVSGQDRNVTDGLWAMDETIVGQPQPWHTQGLIN